MTPRSWTGNLQMEKEPTASERVARGGSLPFFFGLFPPPPPLLGPGTAFYWLERGLSRERSGRITKSNLGLLLHARKMAARSTHMQPGRTDR